jgi:hypothetical protein
MHSPIAYSLSSSSIRVYYALVTRNLVYMAASSIVKIFIFSLAKTKITVKWFFDSQELVQYLGGVVH